MSVSRGADTRHAQLGADRLDRDLRAVMSFLSTQSPALASGVVREAFARVQQTALVLTLDALDEADDVLAGSSGSKLTSAEVKQIFSQKV